MCFIGGKANLSPVEKPPIFKLELLLLVQQFSLKELLQQEDEISTSDYCCYFQETEIQRWISTCKSLRSPPPAEPELDKKTGSKMSN